VSWQPNPADTTHSTASELLDRPSIFAPQLQQTSRRHSCSCIDVELDCCAHDACLLQVVACIERVQQHMVGVEPALQPCFLEPVTAHMTILVLDIQTQEQEATAESVLARLPGALQQQGLGQLQITLKGLSTFRNQVRPCTGRADAAQ
jgi:hypothetical protein